MVGVGYRGLCLGVILFGVTPIKATPPPNIVILFADNLGYADVGAFSGANPSSTPNIDSLAKDGIRLDNWNSAAHLCSASRAALLTGKLPVRTGIFPGVFKPDAENGLPRGETTLAMALKDLGYSTSIVGKWHLGHRPGYLPTEFGFDEWLGIPYHMSGGSLDGHQCAFDGDSTMWLPLYQNTSIVEQPVKVDDLADRYAKQARGFVASHATHPFFLYLAFSHVHQLCAPINLPEQDFCQWSSRGRRPQDQSTFANALEEMDWIAGEVLDALDQAQVAKNTIVVFSSDNGPWVAEQACAGLKGPFEGAWLKKNVDDSCTACPHDYVPAPTEERPRRCELPGTTLDLDGVHCGSDTGLGSAWEANLRMPTIIRWTGEITAGSSSSALLSTLDVFPTILALAGGQPATLGDIDGTDISDVILGRQDDIKDRFLFFWRDGFESGPLPAPYGRMDVVAVKYGSIKAWFYTKSAHYNSDVEVRHEPPLLFDTVADPAEAHPLDTSDYVEVIDIVKQAVYQHKLSVDLTNPGPLTTARDPQYIPCVDRSTGCRTQKQGDSLKETVETS